MTAIDRASNTGERILEFARECFEEVGIRRTSMEDIARAAGVGRTTVFRLFESKERIVQIVVLRIIAEIEAEVRAAFVQEDDVETALTEAVVVWMRAFRENALFSKMMRIEPEVFMGALTQGGSLLIEAIRSSVTQWLGTSGGGPLPDRDAEATAEILIRLGISLVIAPGGNMPIEDDRAIREYLRRYVVPGIALLAQSD